jgi:hypothetical protein
MYSILGIPVPNEDLFIYFVTHCHCRLHLSYSTIRTSLAGIRFWYIDRQAINPFVSIFGQPMLRLHWILRAIKKEQGVVASTRLPITYPILEQLISTLQSGVFGTYVDLMMQAACLLAFFGFLRCSEFTQKSMSSDINSSIQMRDVVVRSESVSVRIKSSKTDPFRQGTWVHLYRTGNANCPVRALTAWFRTRSRLGSLEQSDDPFLAMSDGTPLTRYRFASYMKALLVRAGHNPSGFTPHSFRSGAATSASVGQVPDHIIRHLGRWSSDCYQRYITPEASTVKHAMQSMSYCA